MKFTRIFYNVSRRYSTVPSLPLEGVRVIDMSRVLAGPYCTQLLGDLGAEIIKIEHPKRGDDTRAWGPPFAKNNKNPDSPGESAYYLSVNRNKKSIGIDFQKKEGQSLLKQLISSADVLVENYLPGSLAKYGLSYQQLLEDPELAEADRAAGREGSADRLIYASITGYGQTGPLRNRPGYDVMVEAEMGLMHITGPKGGEPVKVGVAVTDLTTGLYACNSILAALLFRNKTGKGTYLDVSLSDCQTATLANIGSSVLISGKPDAGRMGTEHPSIVPYQAFQTKPAVDSDGNEKPQSIMVGAANDKLFRSLCDLLGKPEWKSDSKYLTNMQRVANRKELVQEIQNIMSTRTLPEWLAEFEQRDIPFAAINDIQATMNHPQTLARNMVVEKHHPACGPIKMINTPVKASRYSPGIRSVPPLLNEHSDEVLAGLGFSEDKIAELKEKGVVG